MRELLCALFILSLGTTTQAWEPGTDDPEPEYRAHAIRALPRDVFPVFDDPDPVSAAIASARLRPREWVIGVSINNAHRAYPVEMMGVAELGNDTLGGHPIAVCW